MHPLHDYVAKQLAEKIKSRQIVVWYDLRREFLPFIDELRGAGAADDGLYAVTMAGMDLHLAMYGGSYFQLRAQVEPLVASNAPPALLIYVGEARDQHGSVLMELEKAGTCYEPQLKRFARNLLSQRYTAGVVDEFLSPERVTYEDLARAASDASGTEPPSLLKGIFQDVNGNDAILVAWMASDARDADIDAKEAKSELVKLVRSRLGLELGGDAPLPKLRVVTLRYVLASEFRLDLRCPAPAGLDGVAAPKTKDEEAGVRDVAQRLRTGFPDEYAAIADRIEAELKLHPATVPAGALGSVNTFRFEERALLAHCGDLVVAERFDDALGVVRAREHCYWLDRDLARKAQWEAVRRMAELGSVARSVRASVAKTRNGPQAWVDAYSGKDGWYRLDRAQRRLETWLTSLDEEPDERPLGLVRRAYDDVCRVMAEGFTQSLARAAWTVSGPLHQTRIYSEVVAAKPKPVAYFLVDAMRFEMGVELSERLPKTAEVSIWPAVAALPTITPIGMAALMPGAASSFGVTNQNGRLGARVGDTFLPDVAARKRFAAARVPQLVDLALDELLSLQPSKLAKRLADAQVILVRSQEIDHAGETGFSFQARQVMDTVIDNLARAIRKLASAGVEHSVVTADHGHLFFAADRDESMRADSPGGKQVELHRRCWIGRGGAIPAGCVRVSASELGYMSDLEFVFPMGSGVFKAGGDLAYHHGGPSLQELVIPVVRVRLKVRETKPAKAGPVEATNAPATITNRIFTVVLQGDLLAGEQLVRPLLVSEGRQVGGVGMAIEAEFDRSTGCVKLQPGKPITVAFLLADESVSSIRIVVQDPATDAELFRSTADIPVRLGV